MLYSFAIFLCANLICNRQDIFYTTEATIKSVYTSDDWYYIGCGNKEVLKREPLLPPQRLKRHVQGKFITSHYLSGVYPRTNHVGHFIICRYKIKLETFGLSERKLKVVRKQIYKKKMESSRPKSKRAVNRRCASIDNDPVNNHH